MENSNETMVIDADYTEGVAQFSTQKTRVSRGKCYACRSEPTTAEEEDGHTCMSEIECVDYKQWKERRYTKKKKD